MKFLKNPLLYIVLSWFGFFLFLVGTYFDFPLRWGIIFTAFLSSVILNISGLIVLSIAVRSKNLVQKASIKLYSALLIFSLLLNLYYVIAQSIFYLGLQSI
jgi:hypothetical protein